MSAISPTPSPGPLIAPPPGPDRWSVDQLQPHNAGQEVGRPLEATPGVELWHQFARGIKRRWRRERRRRKVGRAYDMATEIARTIPHGSRVLDVGCGNGYIAHHLSALLGVAVNGIDVAKVTDAPIAYKQFDGKIFPVQDSSFDVALFCYVLHHAQDIKPILREVHRVLRKDGWLVVYEDVPIKGWDRVACAIHDRQWRGRTGPCTFRGEREWRDTFASEGFELCETRRLSRWRNVFHPVSRQRFLLRPKG